MTPERHDYIPKNQKPIICACGCGEALDRDGRNSKYRFDCKKRIEKIQQDGYRKAAQNKRKNIAERKID